MVLDVNVFGSTMVLVHSTIDNKSIVVHMNNNWGLLC